MPELPSTFREQLRTLLPDEGYTITADEVMASVERTRAEGSPPSVPTPAMPRRPLRGFAPALAWMLGLLILVAVGVGIFVGVNGTTTTKPASVGGTERLADHLVLDATRIVAGQSVDGNLVVYNLGKTFNLTTKGCQPQLVVGLNRGTFHQTIAFAAVCDGAPLLIDHGTTRLPVTVGTTYDQCSQSGPGTPSLPKCLADGGIPPLPAGTYMAKVVWDAQVPLPTPKEVTLTLTTTSPTTPPSTTTSPRTPTSALPGAPPCDTEPTTGPAIRPTEIFFGCATSADYLGPITWSSWTSTSATGTATHNVNSCQPDCATGTYTRFPVVVQLSNPGYLGGIFVFQTITTTLTSSAGKPESSTATHLYGSWGWPSS